MPVKNLRYDQLIIRAIASINKIGGTSVPAIRDWVRAAKPRATDKKIWLYLKRLQKEGKIIKEKSSFKLTRTTREAVKA